MSELLDGQLVAVTAVVTTPPPANTPVDDPTVALSIFLNGVPVTPAPAVSHVGAAGSGTYTADFTLAGSGWWEFVFSGTTTAAGKGRARVYVSSVP